MTIDQGLLLLRLVVGLLFVGHGAQKLFGWFGGHGFSGTSRWIASMGFRPAWLWTLFAGLGEFVGGLLLALGLLIPIGPLAIIAVMLMAIAKAHWPKLWVTEGGFEYPLVNIAVAVVIGLLGAGRISLDAVLGTQLPLPVSFWIGLAIVIIGWLAGVLTSQRSAERPAERPSELEQRRAA